MSTLVASQASGKVVEVSSALERDSALVLRQLRSAADVRVGEANNGGVKQWELAVPCHLAQFGCGSVAMFG